MSAERLAIMNVHTSQGHLPVRDVSLKYRKRFHRKRCFNRVLSLIPSERAKISTRSKKMLSDVVFFSPRNLNGQLCTAFRIRRSSLRLAGVERSRCSKSCNQLSRSRLYWVRSFSHSVRDFWSCCRSLCIPVSLMFGCDEPCCSSCREPSSRFRSPPAPISMR